MRERLWWCLPVLVLSAADGLITLWGQPEAYWSSGFAVVNEANPLAAWLLTVHPLAFAASGVPYLLLVLVVVLLLPRRWAAGVAVVIASSHALAVGAWCVVLFVQPLFPLAIEGLALVALGVLLWRRDRVARAQSETAGDRPSAKAVLLLGGCFVASVILVGLGVSTRSNLRPGDSRAIGEEAKKLQGTWGVTSFERNGEKVQGNELEGMWLAVEGDEMILHESETKKSQWRFKIDTSMKPWAMDCTVTGRREQTALCIYELNGDVLKLCWRTPGGDRPTEFGGKDADGFLILKKR